MSISRDRLTRDVDLAEIFNSRRRSFYVWGSGGEDFGPVTPFRWGATPMTGTNRVMGLASVSVGDTSGEIGSGRGILGVPRVNRRGGFRGSPGSVIGRENRFPAMRSGGIRARGRGRNVLPSWYPRRPLQDITPIVRALERRRAREGEDEGLQLESPVAQDRSVHDSIASTSGAQLEQDLSIKTPAPTVGKRNFPLTVRKLPKLLLDITRDNAGDSAFLTPQKKLLNSIEAVEKVVMEELHEWKNSPAAKKAEREKKIRTLMSMR